MRCPGCERFTSLETGEPEVSDLRVDDGSVMATVRVVRNCADCGLEMKEAEFEVEEPLGHVEPADHEHEFEAEENGVEATESGGGRYKKNMVGFSLGVVVTCAVEGCGFSREVSAEDSMPASAYSEL